MIKKLPLIILILLIPFRPSFADDSVYEGDGFHVYPVQNSAVQLVAETIVINDLGRRPGQGRFTVDVNMTFKNQGAETTIQMGFPVVTNDYDDEIDTHFRTWVNGQEVKIEKKRGVPHPQIKNYSFSELVYAYTVSFKSGETKKIKHSYDVGGSFDSMGGWQFQYVLRTGALWAGVIEDFSLIYRANINSVKDLIGSIPREQKAIVDGDEFRLLWTIKNFKPQSDFKLIGGSSKFPLMRRTLSEDRSEMQKFHMIMTAGELRYAKNKVYASYGYPFKNPFMRAQFYYQGSPYKESMSFSENNMTKEHLEYVKWLSKLEDETLKKEIF